MSLLSMAAMYFTSRLVLLVLVSLYAAVAGLFLAFRANPQNPRLRSKLLLTVFSLATASWIFIGSSLVLCKVFEGMYYYHGAEAVTMVLGGSLFATLVIGVPVSLFMGTRVPSLVLRRLEKQLSEPHESTSVLMNRMVSVLGLGEVHLYRYSGSVPFAFSLGGKRNVVVISGGLEENLDRDELETVLTHELGHLKNMDTLLNALITVYRRLLFFDPLIRFLEGIIHKEREFACDDISARTTRKPLALASALIKIHSAAADARPPGAFLAGNIGLHGNRALKERIDRLLRISEELDQAHHGSLSQRNSEAS
ncbi:MAG: M56 family metallopeptidase [Thaumarchaeota archaeon]|nr:M56 family metallopeptidase [Nitrososphaerota archaeon]